MAIDVLARSGPDHARFGEGTTTILCRRIIPGLGSFTLDEIHNPHVTVLQCFVKTADLEKVKTAVAAVVKSEKPAK